MVERGESDPGGDVTLDELIRFFEHPARDLLRQRLGVRFVADVDEPSDALCIELTGIDKWGVAEVAPLVAEAGPYLVADPDTLDAVVDLDGTQLAGTIAGIRGDTILRVTNSRLAAKHWSRAWLQLLALTAAHPSAWTAVTIGNGRDAWQRSSLGPVDPEHALALLADLVELRADGLRRVLPLATRTSATYAERRRLGEDTALRKAAQQWERGRCPSARTPRTRCWATVPTSRSCSRSLPRSSRTSRRCSASSRCGCGTRCSLTRGAAPTKVSL